MIVFDLCCEAGHRFEGWFASSDEFARQHNRKLVACPQCGSLAVEKAPMAPAVPRKSNQVTAPSAPAVSDGGAGGEIPPAVAKALMKLALAQAKALEGSQWVGDAFVEQSRAMHYGEREAQPIHGKATPDEALEMAEEGIAVALLPFPVAPPDDVN